MGKFVKGEIVILIFPFSNLAGSKRRPALVISELTGDDIILCQITASRKDAYSVELAQSDFSSGLLPQSPSYIRSNKIFTADSSIIVRKEGAIKSSKYKEVIGKIIGIIS